MTVSVVCLLSLIAYTFIADKDLPKLSYLTVMDYIILLSYFFAAVPTVQTIFVHSIGSKVGNSAKLIDKKFRLATPLVYIFYLL